jgi:glycerol-3-phosphate dehydrogenase
LRIALVEQADFASGTSSRSSRLLHGGLRYLAQGHIGLVREASKEKMILHRLAPHLSQPLPFVFPAWRGDGPPLWELAAGVQLYELLAGGRNLSLSSIYGASRLLSEIPGLRGAGLKGGVRYFDALTNDARLVIDTLRSADRAGAVLLNYTRFLTSEWQGGRWRCRLRDELSGETFGLHASAIVNAAGAWASRFPQSHVRLRLTKGAHVVADRSRLPVPAAVVLSHGDRILFVIPWGERVILGTTDTDYEGDPAEVRTDASDITYILGVVNSAFPRARLTPADLIASWAGVRPLIAPARNAKDAPSDISRKHEIRITEPGWIDVAGGKLTTYRLMAEQVVDRLDGKLPHSRTAETPLLAAADTTLSGVIPPPITTDVVRRCCREEWAIHLDDVLLRRTSWHFYHSNHMEIANSVAGWMAEELAWSVAQTQSEVERYLRTAEFIR